MLIHELVYIAYMLRFRLSLYNPVFQSYREITSASFYMNMRWIVVKGIYVIKSPRITNIDPISTVFYTNVANFLLISRFRESYQQISTL